MKSRRGREEILQSYVEQKRTVVIVYSKSAAKLSLRLQLGRPHWLAPRNLPSIDTVPRKSGNFSTAVTTKLVVLPKLNSRDTVIPQKLGSSASPVAERGRPWTAGGEEKCRAPSRQYLVNRMTFGLR
jgi:hypothetical protein